MSLLIGLTGNIACGKSTVGEIFESLGIKVLDSDAVVHDIYGNDESVKASLEKSFGTSSRKEIAQLVFGPDLDEKTRREKLSNLEGIIHPKVDMAFRDWVKENQKDEFLVNLVPLLFEAKLESRYDYIVTVTSTKEQQFERLKIRNPELSDQEISNRIESQMSLAEKAAKSDFQIDNSSNKDDLVIQVDEILDEIKSKENSSLV